MDNEERTLAAVVEAIALPYAAYDKARRRYESLGEWFARPESTLALNDPHIYVQGSFALGTAIKPWLEGESYDLDLSCKLREGIHRSTHTQAELKNLVGIELEGYREALQIQEPLEEKNRCWRLYYQDGMSFHMDVVPGVPVDESRRMALSAAMESYGFQQVLATDVAELAAYITDIRDTSYELISQDWLLSNPEGYAKWFESKCEPLGLRLSAEAAQVDDVPYHEHITHLQRAIQLLKRHRDVMYQDSPDSKPISVIITTLAAEAYDSPANLSQALASCLMAMKRFVDSDSDTVPNPVNPVENFADRWFTSEGRALQLKENFYRWVRQALRDFNAIGKLDAKTLVEHIKEVFDVTISSTQLETGFSVAPSYLPTIDVSQPPSPWSRRD
ncbi:nucleotidyltransferase [Pseudomonas yamanorum]|uniref:nucleotidyltransferase domain-containing protein n=1 Tax=Pseudomonas yamanorum TaxID=515393 RepID=UPI001C44AB0B|nr:nucleotidyltransferase [Pseudomonas yamanorum]MBV6659795.1 nucleotidyltransferase [Pseudomonas yamanorum]